LIAKRATGKILDKQQARVALYAHFDERVQSAIVPGDVEVFHRVVRKVFA
jgi:hypothetical protein